MSEEIMKIEKTLVFDRGFYRVKTTVISKDRALGSMRLME